MEKRIRPIIALLLSGTIALPVAAVEALDESAMGNVHVQSRNVLNIAGPTAAGDGEPPIQLTSGTRSSLAMALNLRGSESNRRQEEVDTLEAPSIAALLFPSLDFEVPVERTVPSPVSSGGSTTALILASERNIRSRVEFIGGQPAIAFDIDTRVQEFRFEDIRFPSSVTFDGTTVMRGFEFRASGLLQESFGN